MLKNITQIYQKLSLEKMKAIYSHACYIFCTKKYSNTSDSYLYDT